MKPVWIHLGTLVRPHGIRGELRVQWYGQAALRPGAPLWLQQGGEQPSPVRLLAVRWHRGMPLARLEGVADRTAAELLRGAKLLAQRRELPAAAQDEAYLCDLMGCDVLLPDGSRLGRLDHVESPAGQELWSIVTDAGREVLFPAQPQFITGFGQGSVSIAPPEGLLDIYLSPDD